MTWPVVARKDFYDAARSRMLWAILALCILSMAGIAILFGTLLDSVTAAAPGQGQGQAAGLYGQMVTLVLIVFLTGAVFGGVGPVLTVVPIVGLAAGYKSIVDERESGRLKLLLSLPHDRLDVVVGKFAGRTAVVAVSVLVGLVVAMVAFLAYFGSFDFGSYLAFVLLTLVFTLVHVAIGVGISAASPSDGWALSLVIGFVAVFQLLWGGIFFVLKELFFKEAARLPAWLRFVHEASPGRAFSHALATSVWVPREAAESGVLSSTDAIYPGWFGLVLLVLWIVVPLGFGYWRFRGADLG